MEFSLLRRCPPPLDPPETPYSTRKSNTCAGDSGSPLMRAVMDDVNGLSVERWYVVGILSTGPENCDQDTAYESVFTRVSEYDDWIAGLQN